MVQSNLKNYIINLILFFFITSIIFSQNEVTKGDFFLLGKSDLKEILRLGLLPEAYLKFKEMQNDAKKEGIEIEIVSGYRSYQKQKYIWNNKYNKNFKKGIFGIKNINRIIQYSTLPGTSRHHWGTDIDIIDKRFTPEGDLLIEKNYSENGIYSQLYRWMKKNSKKYRFYLVYDDSPKRKGFKFEPWHYSYKPLSMVFLKRFIEGNLLFEITQDSSLLGRQFIDNSFLESYLKDNLLDININLK
jgi:LAS superfamily LD-carboxypeptidase LdcB